MDRCRNCDSAHHFGNARIIDTQRPRCRDAPGADHRRIFQGASQSGIHSFRRHGPDFCRMKSSSWKSAMASPAGRALLALILVLAAGCLFNADHAFFKLGTHRDTLRQASVYGILACGMTLVIISAGIDLAVGSVVALTAVCVATLSLHWNWPAWEA